jgi:O-antigen/teichoic acid export membrane protein
MPQLVQVINHHKNRFLSLVKKEGLKKAVITSLDINKALLYSFGNKFWAIIVGIVNIALITSYFSSVEQGYYYAFYNLIVFQTLLDVGFGTVLVQFVSHEWAHLKFNEAGEIDGDKHNLERLAALIRISLKWYIKVAIVFFVIIGIGGYWFIDAGKDNISFLVPWLFLCGTVCLSLLIVPFRFFLEGSNQIHKSQQILLVSSIVAGLATWASIIFKLGLYTPFVTSFVTFLITLFYLWRVAKPYWKIISIKGADDKKLWKEEFWTQQWRIAVSWLCGYFMFQSFVPTAFHLLGSVEAGKIGATMQLFQVVNLVGMVWVNVNLPKMGIMSAKKQYDELERLVKRIFLISTAIAFISFFFVMLGVQVLQWLHIKQVERLADTKTLLLFLITAVILQLSNIVTASIRSQKKEPFMLSSIVGAALIISFNFLLAKQYSSFGLSLSFFGIVTFVLVPWVYSIYKKEMTKLKMGANAG